MMIKTFVFLFFNNNRENFEINTLTKHMFSFIISETIIMIEIMIRHCIEKFKHEAQILIHFERQCIKRTYFSSLTTEIFVLTICE